MWKETKGFTIIEFLVAMAVIAVLAGIIFPIFLQAREKGRQTACLSNLRQLGVATLMYAYDNDGRFPPYMNTLEPRPNPDGYSAPHLLYAALSPCLKSGKVWYCPSDPFAGQDVSRWHVYHRYSSYRFNLKKGYRVRHDGYWEHGRLIWTASKLPLIRDPRNPFMDRNDPVRGGWHFEGRNTFFLDGHAEWVKLDLPD